MIVAEIKLLEKLRVFDALNATDVIPAEVEHSQLRTADFLDIYDSVIGKIELFETRPPN